MQGLQPRHDACWHNVAACLPALGLSGLENDEDVVSRLAIAGHCVPFVNGLAVADRQA